MNSLDGGGANHDDVNLANKESSSLRLFCFISSSHLPFRLNPINCANSVFNPTAAAAAA